MGLAEVLHWPSGGPSQRHMLGSDDGAGFAFQQRKRRRQRPAPLAETAHHSTYSGPGGPYSPPFTAYAEAQGSGRSPGSPPAPTAMPTGTGSSPGSFAPASASKNTATTAVRPATETLHQQHQHHHQHHHHSCSPPSSSSSPPPQQHQHQHQHQHQQQAAFPSSVYRHARRLASSASSASSSSSPSSSSHRRRSSRSSAANTTMPEYRHMRSSSLSVPGNGGSPSGRGSNPGAGAAANSVMPRSPPNTSHVPCKFFRQGACQAGNACPFSHDLGASSDNVCKYFAKGNCKFGPKCANIHVLPDGRRVNYGKNGFTIITTPANLAGNAPNSPNSASSNKASALTTSLYQADQPGFPSFPGDDRQHLHAAHHNLDNGHHPDSQYAMPDSSYGSPRDIYGLSPVNGKGLSVLDAPLPASFDSNGVSNAARFPAAPWPSSVPSKFGLESPTPSLSNAKDSRTSDTLKLLHTSAFGSSDHLTPTPNSPPNASGNSEEYFGKRAMHSSRYSKPRMMSSSVPKANVDRDWEAEFAFGDDNGDNAPENYVPENLQDLLTPAEKARRGSMRGENDVSLETLSKYGSPIGSSPSRWGPLFQRQKEEEEQARAARAGASPFGHVGSPLRNSTLAQEMGSSEALSSSASGRPSSMRMGSDSMSVLSQQLQRSRLDEATAGSSPLLHPVSARTGPPAGSAVAAIGKDRAMERHVSTGSVGSSVTGRFTTPIDEEDPAFVFSMEEDDPVAAARMRKRASAGLGVGSFSSYAGAVTGKGQDEKSKEAGDSSATER